MFYKKKCIYLIVCILFLGFSCYAVYKDEKQPNIQEIQNERKENHKFISGVKIDDIFGMYNIKENLYYFSCNPSKIDRIKIYSPYKIQYVINKENDNTYKIFVYSDKYYNTVKIVFNNMSYITINDIDVFGEYKRKTFFDSKEYIIPEEKNKLDNKAYFISSSSNYEKYEHILYSSSNSIGTIRERGGTSLVFSKKAYKIELNSSDSLCGMNKDDDWILDALYTDFSKIRNKLSYDMWNLINNNQIVDNDVNGEFVEVYLNSEYNGLYVLKEKVDRSIAKVSNDGILLKSTAYHSDDSIINQNSDGNLLFNRFEVKYNSDNSLLKFIDKYIYYYDNPLDYNHISNTFYLDNFINYRILLSLISGNDNLIKNQYWSMINSKSKILITPWDLDLTWGLVWKNDNLYNSSFSMHTYYDINWMNENICNIDNKTKKIIKDRYFELRKNVITMETINTLLDSYKELLIGSGAAVRDSEKWYEYDIEYEIENIREWANHRIEFLDEYFKNLC